MVKTVEAIIDEYGNIELLEEVRLGRRHRALVTILEESTINLDETALLSEQALQDWNRPEEDEAWSYLQQAQ